MADRQPQRVNARRTATGMAVVVAALVVLALAVSSGALGDTEFRNQPRSAPASPP